MCGIEAIVPKHIGSISSIKNMQNVAEQINSAITNRGESSCGLTVINTEPNNNNLSRIRYEGHFADAEAIQAFYKGIKTPQKMIAQARFTTNGDGTLLNAQPIVVYADGSGNDKQIEVFNGDNIHPPYAKDSFKGNNVLTLAHNGEIGIPKKDKIFSERGYFFDDSEDKSDSMLLAAYLFSGLIENDGDLAKTMKEAINDVNGTYSFIADANVDGFEGLFAYRCGRRPLAIADTPDFFALASETGHLINSGIHSENVRMIEPGMLHTFIYENDIILHETEKITDNPNPYCFFEGPVYLQDHTSYSDPLPPQMFDPDFIEVLNGNIEMEYYIPSKEAIEKSQKNHSCMTARELIGQWLFRLRGDEIPEQYRTGAGVPRSGLSVMGGLSLEAIKNNRGITLGEYISINEQYKRSNGQTPRDFLKDQKDREENRPEKLLYRDMPENIIIGEDSVVTGRNILDVIKNCKDKGAENIILIVGSPPIINACYDGINMKYGHQFPQKLYPDIAEQEIYDRVVNHLDLFERDAAEYLGIEKVIYMPVKPIEMLLGPAYAYGCVGGSRCSC